MAIDNPQGPEISEPPGRATERRLVSILQPLASLRLTVILFVLSIVLIMIGTLAQEDEGMWDVLQNYFRTWWCWVPLDVFFPKSFFPSEPQIRGGFPFLGGWSLGLLLGLNLLAAHFVRFKVQAKGGRLAAGLALMAVAVGLIGLIIYTAQAADAVQGDAALSWNAIWLTIRWGSAVAWIASVVWVVASGQRGIAYWMKIALSIVLGAGAFWLVAFGENHRFDDASLRILWQLMQGSVAGILLLAGSWMVFKQRAGIVVIHLGVGLLMFGELLVSLKAVEERMFIREGETVSRASESRVLELAVIDRSPANYDEVVSIPSSLLRKGHELQHEALPFDIELVEFMKNSKLHPTERLKQLRDQEITDANDFLALRLLLSEEAEGPTYEGENRATTGTGVNVVAEAARPLGAGSPKENEAAAYIRIKPKAGQNPAAHPPQTLLVAQRFGDASMILGAPMDLYEPVVWNGKTYDIALRNRRNQKPFALTLEDIRKEDYIGTATPRDYSSYIVLNDPSRQVVDRKIRIWMNNPLRYAGQTIYQSGYHPLPSGEATSLQLVTNTGWMIPYVACMIVIVGLMSHFLLSLSRFISRQTRESQKVVEPALQASWASRVAIPAVAAGLCLMMIGGSLRPRPSIVDGMNLSEFAKLPIVYQGRVKPIDTLARNTLKVVSNKQDFKDTTLTEPSRQPAIKWLLDVVTNSSDADKHRVFYIANLDVLEVLGLQPRKRFKYAVEEFIDKMPDFDKEARKAYELSKSHPEQMTLYRQSLLDTHTRLQTASRLRDAFTPIPFPDVPSAEARAEDPEAADEKLREIARLALHADDLNERLMNMQPPLVVPTGENETEWMPFAAAVNKAYVGQILLHEPVDEATLAWNQMLSSYANGDTRTFNRQVSQYQRRMVSVAPQGVDMNKIDFESYFNRLKPFYWCMALYVLAFVITALGWMGWFEPLRRLSMWLLIFTLCLHTFALWGRIYISGRPPVTNLYSSALFIGWAAVLLSIVLESLYRVSIGNVVAATSGFVTLFIAHNLAGDGDTFTVLQAVLDTQFWLATHVVCITLGYATTFLAGGLATIYILGSVLFRAISADIAKMLARMIYGTVCFSLFFSFFGTVLGGLWADDSWGRFWGWDPKENGALIILLWNALILHARWGGMIRQRGLAVLAIVGNIATAWSWFGVNELGIGLHSYSDFKNSAKLELGLYVLSQLIIVAIGCLPLAMWRGGPAWKTDSKPQ
jgi:ABC-type transport system involved in cytochrome c biogenesis permease subunit